MLNGMLNALRPASATEVAVAVMAPPLFVVAKGLQALLTPPVGASPDAASSLSAPPRPVSAISPERQAPRSSVSGGLSRPRPY